MIELNYHFSTEWNHKVDCINLEGADETMLRYNAFLGDIKLRVDGIELGTDFGWVPIVDFAVCLKQIVVNLGVSETGEALFDFTESDAAIRFERKGQYVEIGPNYTTASGKVLFGDFVAAVKAFVAHLRADVINRFPSLGSNHVFNHLMGKP